MKSSLPFFVLLTIWITTMAPMCKPKQVQDAAKTAAKTKAGQKVVQKAEELVAKLKPEPKKPIVPLTPKPNINPMPILNTARVVFKVVDATGKAVNVTNPALQTELSLTYAIEQPRIVQIAEKMHRKLLIARAMNNGELTYEQQLVAFRDILKEIDASKGLYTFALGTVFYRKKCNTNSDYYIISSKSV